MHGNRLILRILNAYTFKYIPVLRAFRLFQSCDPRNGGLYERSLSDLLLTRPQNIPVFSHVVSEAAAIKAFTSSPHSPDPCAYKNRCDKMLHVNFCFILITDLHKIKLTIKSTSGCMSRTTCTVKYAVTSKYMDFSFPHCQT